MNKIGFSNLPPATGEQRKRGLEVVEEILTIKDELVRLDNQKPFDQDRRHGAMEVLAQNVPGRGVMLGDLRFDATSEQKPLLSMNLSFSLNPESGNGTFIADETCKNYTAHIHDQTQMFSRYDHATRKMETVYVDLTNGELAYREEVR